MEFTHTSFAEASAVEPAGIGVWRAEVRPDWDITSATNGGYLMAIAARAGALAADRPDPVTITGHFLSPARPGPVQVETAVLKSGRRLATVSSVVRAGDGRAVVATLGTYGSLEPVAAPYQVRAAPPELPPVDECIPIEPTKTFPPPFMAQVDLRLHPDEALFGLGRPTGVPRVRGWFRWRNGQPLDTHSLIVATDAFPPTIFNANLPVAWTPTVELTTHLRERPDPNEWLRCAFTTRFISGGFLEEDGEIWDRRDRLIAQSRQLALLPRG